MRTHRDFRIRRLVDDRYRPETCTNIGCDAREHGWTTIVPPEGPQAAYIRNQSKRRYVEEPPGVFLFAAGQECFATHYVAREVFSADLRIHARGVDWVEEFADHQDKLVSAIKEV